MLQRLEWWPEQEAAGVQEYIKSHNISEDELIDILNAYSLNPRYVLDRIQGKQEPMNFFGDMSSREDMSFTDDDSICFICCSNDQDELKEMEAWIDRLIVPENVSVQKAAIVGADSMCSGYNRAMKASFAKYKVYLHQDVRILNPFFIYDLIDAFRRNPDAGMIGMIGTESVPDSGVMWQAKRYGAVVHTESSEEHMADTFDENSPFGSDFSAALTDGFLIATCVDLPWREDVFKGWHFYDASQSMEFKSHGYNIIIPTQDPTWCLHDFGSIGWNGYDEARQLFVETYLEGKKESSMALKTDLQKLIEAGDYDGAAKLMEDNLRSEIDNLRTDAHYCLLAATAYLQTERLSRAFDLITMGLLADNHNYELYLTLGEYYGRTNINKALLCFYQALHYCDVEDDRQVIEGYIENVVNSGAMLRQVSVVIVTRNQSEKLKNCLNSVVNTIVEGLYEIVVVDNCSTDGTRDWLSEIEGITYSYNDSDLGYTAACNQGIKLTNQFNDVLLLDADAMLIDNSLFYLMLALYSDEKNAVVGGITNEFIIDQRMSVDTSNMEEAVKMAASVNCPMDDACEDAVYVSDYAMLIRREAFDKVGLLDERFSPDLYEDKDFCIRVHMAGLRVILCFNSYIFKFMDRNRIYGNTEKMTERNKKQFVDKWGFSIDYSNIARTALIDMIQEEKNKPIEVLELGCAMGSTLNRIKRFWPNARIHGVEYDPGVAEVAAHITDIIQSDVENMVIPYEQKQFDYIICADVLEHLRNPEATVRRFMPYLKDNGHFLISLPNIRHHAVLSMIALQGRFDYGDSGILDRTHVKFFTRDTAIEMLESAGLQVLKVDRNYNGQVGESEFVTRLAQAFDVFDPEELNVFQYYFLAKKK